MCINSSMAHADIKKGKTYELWSEICEIIGDPSLWPVDIRKLFWTKNIKNFDRLRVCAFVFVNGLNPAIFLEWCDIMGLLRDLSAKEHVRYLLGKFEDQHPTYTKYFAYNVTMRRLEFINGQAKK